MSEFETRPEDLQLESAFQEVLRNLQDKGRMINAIHTLGRIAFRGAITSQKAQDKLHELLTDPNPEVRMAAVQQYRTIISVKKNDLEKRELTEKMLMVILERADDDDVRVSVEALRGLGSVASEGFLSDEIEGKLREVFDNQERPSAERDMAAMQLSYLAERGDPEIVGHLTGMLQSQNWRDRLWAGYHLKRVGTQEQLEPIQEQLDENFDDYIYGRKKDEQIEGQES